MSIISAIPPSAGVAPINTEVSLSLTLPLLLFFDEKKHLFLTELKISMTCPLGMLLNMGSCH